jgi:hypothetical protein
MLLYHSFVLHDLRRPSATHVLITDLATHGSPLVGVQAIIVNIVVRPEKEKRKKS